MGFGGDGYYGILFFKHCCGVCAEFPLDGEIVFGERLVLIP